MKVVVIGGGFGGVTAAIELAKRSKARVTLISDTAHVLHRGVIYRAVTGQDVSQACIPLKDIVKPYPNIRLVQDRITHIDAENRSIQGASKRYAYDRLIVAVGLVDYFRGVHGAKKFSYALSSEADIRQFGEQFHDEVVADEGNMTCAVIGGGLTGVELAGFLAEYAMRVKLAHHAHTQPKILLIERSDRLLPQVSVSAGQLVQRRLAKMGVAVKLKHTVERVSSSTMTVDNVPVHVDMAVWALGGRLNPLLSNHTDIFHVSRNGRVCVNQYLEAYPGIFVIGDCADTPFAGWAQTAVRQARFVARHITSLEMRARTAYRPVESRPLVSVPVSRFWAYSERHGVYVAGVIGSMVRRVAELNSYCYILPFRQAYATWRKGRSRVQPCDLCTSFREKS